MKYNGNEAETANTASAREFDIRDDYMMLTAGVQEALRLAEICEQFSTQEITISFPCCPDKKVVLTRNTRGAVSIECPYCGKYAIFDFDHRTSIRGKTLRGLSREVRHRK